MLGTNARVARILKIILAAGACAMIVDVLHHGRLGIYDALTTGPQRQKIVPVDRRFNNRHDTTRGTYNNDYVVAQKTNGDLSNSITSNATIQQNNENSLNQNEANNVIDITYPSTAVQLPPKNSSVNILNPGENVTCKRQDNIFYLKVHKTGSSTMTTLLHRYIYRHNLTAVPVPKQVFPFTQIYKKAIKYPNEGPETKYNLFTEHVVFDADEASRVMYPDAVYLASVREPLSLLKSIFKEFGVHKSLEEIRYAIDPVLAYLNMSDQRDKIKSLSINKRYLLRNTMALEFGLPEHRQDDPSSWDEFIRSVDEKFSFVIITEYFAESLVLLKRQLCWSTEDIAYIKQRSRQYTTKTKTYDQNIIDIHKNLSTLDYKLYDHFLNKFLRLKNQSKDIDDEVSDFNTINDQIYHFCVEGYKQFLTENGRFSTVLSQNKTLHVKSNRWGSGFSVNMVDCAMMHMDTVQLRHLANARLHPEYCAWMVERNYLQPDHCARIHPDYNIPLDILDKRSYYMGGIP